MNLQRVNRNCVMTDELNSNARYTEKRFYILHCIEFQFISNWGIVIKVNILSVKSEWKCNYCIKVRLLPIIRTLCNLRCMLLEKVFLGKKAGKNLMKTHMHTCHMMMTLMRWVRKRRRGEVGWQWGRWDWQGAPLGWSNKNRVWLRISTSSRISWAIWWSWRWVLCSFI